MTRAIYYIGFAVAYFIRLVRLGYRDGSGVASDRLRLKMKGVRL